MIVAEGEKKRVKRLEERTKGEQIKFISLFDDVGHSKWEQLLSENMRSQLW